MSNNIDKYLFKFIQFKRFTFKETKIKLSYRPSKKDPKIYEASREYNWGHYVTYVYKADDAMKIISFKSKAKQSKKKLGKI